MLLSRIGRRFARKRGGADMSVEKKRRIVGWLEKYIASASIFLFAIGIVWILLLPYEGYNKRTYISENALLPAQVNVYYDVKDIHIAEEYRDKLRVIQEKDREIRAAFIQTEFRRIGFTSAVQRFHTNDSDASLSMGMNAFAIYRAPRSDGKEALILSAPWVSRTGQHNTNGIAALLSLANLFKRNTYWSKDIILLVTDQGLAGTQAWLDAYHGTEEGDQAASFSSVVMPRSGVIQGVVNLDFPGEQDYDSLGVFYEGVNGQLPNLDLINTIVLIARNTARVPVALHDDAISPFKDHPWGFYLVPLWHMARTMAYQMLGHPSSDAGLYLRYKIDAVTIHGIYGTTHLHSLFGFHRIGILVESTFRSLNNLLEHFHQSFFFYLLPQLDRYVSIGDYMPPVILFACALVFQSLVLYYVDPRSLTSKEETIRIPPAYSLHKRHVTFAFSVLTVTQLAGVTIFYAMQPTFAQLFLFRWTHDEATVIQSGLAASVAVVTVAGSSVWIMRHPSPAHDYRILKSFLLALDAFVISTVSLLNFSLAVATAVATLVPYTLVGPSRDWKQRVLQWTLLAAISPPGLLSLASLITDRPVIEILSILLADHQQVRSWLLAFLCMAYWPLNMTAHILVSGAQ